MQQYQELSNSESPSKLKNSNRPFQRKRDEQFNDEEEKKQ